MIEKTAPTRNQDRIDPDPALGGEVAPIHVDVLLFAAVREATGLARTAIALPPSATVGMVLEILIGRYPALAGHAKSLRLAVNSEYVESGRLLKSGDEVALIPPTCGG